jgi:hypothetical protein
MKGAESWKAHAERSSGERGWLLVKMLVLGKMKSESMLRKSFATNKSKETWVIAIRTSGIIAFIFKRQY